MSTTTTETTSLRDRLATDLGISAGDTVTVIYDEENSAEAWWDAARLAMRGDTDLPSARARALFAQVNAKGKAVTTRLDAAELFAWGEEIEGWDDGPEHARNPLLTYEGSDED
jgi:hypothetical protein